MPHGQSAHDVSLIFFGLLVYLKTIWTLFFHDSQSFHANYLLLLPIFKRFRALSTLGHGGSHNVYLTYILALFIRLHQSTILVSLIGDEAIELGISGVSENYNRNLSSFTCKDCFDQDFFFASSILQNHLDTL